MSEVRYPAALPAPPEPVVVLGEAHIERALAASRESPRKRVILPFHKQHEELLHRMFNALQPGTYVQPHRHLRSAKHEAFVVLRGAIDFAVFDEQGELTLARRLRAGGQEFGIDLAPGIFHSFVARLPDTLVYEVKEGPYTAMDDKDFAPWAPREGEPEAAAYLARLEVRLAERLGPGV